VTALNTAGTLSFYLQYSFSSMDLRDFNGDGRRICGLSGNFALATPEQKVSRLPSTVSARARSGHIDGQRHVYLISAGNLNYSVITYSLVSSWSQWTQIFGRFS
jgi:hypothetical protein